MKLIFAYTAVFLFVLGCTKDKAILLDVLPPKPPSDFIQMRFIFMNEGDTNLKALNLESSFYRIHLNDSWIKYQYYPNILPDDSIVHYSDSSKVGAQKNLKWKCNL
jgi:hypothetical protein